MYERFASHQVRLPKARSLHSQAWGVAAGEPDMSKPVEPDWKKLLAMTHSPEASTSKTHLSSSSRPLLGASL